MSDRWFHLPVLTQNKCIVRGIGPSLGAFGVPGALADPTLELHAGDGTLLATNDNWKSDQQAEIEATMLQPTNDLESAILATLPADGAGYTAIVKGKNGTTGVGLVEAYDLDATANSKLANISTRGFVDIGDNVMIGGFILGGGSAQVIVRAIGPSLTELWGRRCVAGSNVGAARRLRNAHRFKRQLERIATGRDRGDWSPADERF